VWNVSDVAGRKRVSLQRLIFKLGDRAGLFKQFQARGVVDVSGRSASTAYRSDLMGTKRRLQIDDLVDGVNTFGVAGAAPCREEFSLQLLVGMIVFF